MSVDADLVAGLTRFLAATWGVDVAITDATEASVGAQRRTLLLDLVRNGTPVPAVAQIAETALGSLPLAAQSAVLGLAADAGVPVPAVLATCDDAAYVGAPFVVTTRIEGATVPRHVLRLVETMPDLGERLTDDCATALARLHGIDGDRVPPTIPRPTGPTPSAAYVAELGAQLAELLEPSPTLALGLRWLEQHQPSPPPHLALVHGDFRNGNLIVAPNGLAAILDWELAHVGDPMEDLAYLCLRTWRFRNDHLAVGGFGARARLHDGYTQAGGRWRDDAFTWWQVARSVWWGIGLGRQAAAYLRGDARSLVLAASGRRVAELEWDVLMLLRATYDAR